MIEFYGNYSKNAERLALWMNAKQNFYIVLIVAAVFTGIFLLVAFLFDFWLIMYFEIALVAMVVITLFSPYIERKKSLRLLLPEKVLIDSSGTILVNGKLRIKLDPPGWFGFEISIDFGKIIQDLFGG